MRRKTLGMPPRHGRLMSIACRGDRSTFARINNNRNLRASDAPVPTHAGRACLGRRSRQRGRMAGRGSAMGTADCPGISGGRCRLSRRGLDSYRLGRLLIPGGALQRHGPRPARPPVFPAPGFPGLSLAACSLGLAHTRTLEINSLNPRLIFVFFQVPGSPPNDPISHGGGWFVKSLVGAAPATI